MVLPPDPTLLMVAVAVAQVHIEQILFLLQVHLLLQLLLVLVVLVELGIPAMAQTVEQLLLQHQRQSCPLVVVAVVMDNLV